MRSTSDGRDRVEPYLSVGQENFSSKSGREIFGHRPHPSPLRPGGLAGSRTTVQPWAGERGVFGNRQYMNGHRNGHLPEFLSNCPDLLIGRDTKQIHFHPINPGIYPKNNR